MTPQRILAVLFILAIPTLVAAEERPPNVVIIFCDDMGYADIGPFGAEVDTPHLDRMEKEGRLLTDFYAAQAVCSASRAALMTGCYPNRIGIRGALGPQSNIGLHSDETTIAEILKPLGYATAIFGKWHLGDEPMFYPTNHGFDEYFGLPYSNDMWPRHPTATHFPKLPLWEGNREDGHSVPISNVTPKHQAQLTTWYTEHAVDFINRKHDEPFFLYVPHSMPHVPIFASEKFKGKSGHGLYGDVMQEIDWSVGQILDAIREHGIAENTLVLFSSDNGPWLSYGEHAGSAEPLREGKGTTFEGGQREPTLVWWPEHIPAGTNCSEPCGAIDLLPTIASLTGASMPEKKIDGVDISPLLLEKNCPKSPHEALYFYWGNALQAVRSGKWKLHFPHAYRSLNGRPGGKNGKPTKYTQLHTELALFNLEEDIGEENNVSEEHPEVVARLKGLADKKRAEIGDSRTNTKGSERRPHGRDVRNK